MAGMSHSGAARAGTKSLSQSLGGEWAKHGIVINNIAPGVIHSDSAQANYGPIGDVLFDASRQMTPAGELGRVYEDCVPPIIFMLTPGVQYTTGKFPYKKVNTPLVSKVDKNTFYEKRSSWGIKSCHFLIKLQTFFVNFWYLGVYNAENNGVIFLFHFFFKI